MVEKRESWTDRHPAALKAIVWVLRLVVGGVFVVSGLSKSIDLWGFVYKIEEYLDVWNLPVWRSLSFVVAVVLAGTEFVSGAMLLLGAFRKSVVWWMLLMMAGMLPLTLYIYLADPVSDCGCFGDFLILSNGATFAKNIFLSAALVFLAVYNRRAGYIYNPYIQWIPLVLCSVYVLAVGLIGYNIQPLVDFRSFAPGTELLPADDDDDNDEAEIEFLYRRDGETRAFAIDNLPDSTWTFVDRVGSDMASGSRTDFVIVEDGYDIAPEIISTEGEQIILTIPEFNRADISYTLLLNEIYEREQLRGGSMVCLIGGGEEAVEVWKDYSLASYPVYAAEPTLIKELARGNMALVCLEDGIVTWKRTVSSMSLDDDNGSGYDPSGVVGLIVTDGPEVLMTLTLVLVCALALFATPLFFQMLSRIKFKRKPKKSH
ncbi:MAG: hypothetical protein NC336_05170 [Clostridium sp.]|nr:hypothetical protein [Clostridium sp.]